MRVYYRLLTSIDMSSKMNSENWDWKLDGKKLAQVISYMKNILF